MDCWVSPSVFQARFSQAGGETDRYDSVPVSGEAAQVIAAVDGGATLTQDGANNQISKVWGATGDSGRARRVKNLYACIEELSTGNANQEVFKVRLQIPVHGTGVFTPFTQYDELAESCPLAKSMGALCNMNNWSIEILMEDLTKQIFRNLSSSQARAAGAFSALAPGGYEITMLQEEKYKPRLCTTWLRLPSWRSLPSSITCSTYRVTTHRTTSAVYTGAINVVAASLDDGVQLADVLQSVGSGRRVGGRAMQQATAATKVCQATWSGITSAQVPEYLFFCFQKTPKLFTLDSDFVKRIAGDGTNAAPNPAHDDAAGLRNLMYSRNQDANCSIVDLELTVMSSVGSFTYSSDSYPFIKKRRQLFYDHYRNCVDDYCDSDVNIWSKNKSCLLLHCSSWIRGIATNSTAFPIQISAGIKFQNKREQVDGHCATAENAVGTAVLPDFIAGTPVMCQIFPNGSLVIAASSAVSAAANLSHSTGLDLLSRQAQ